jgi:hypothetical protein
MNNTTTTEPAAADTMAHVMAAAKAFQADGVKISASQGHIVISADTNIHTNDKAAQALVIAAKKALGEALLAAFPGRKFTHARVRGYRLWRQGFVHMGRFSTYGWAVGIDLARTDAELTSILLGCTT